LQKTTGEKMYARLDGKLVSVSLGQAQNGKYYIEDEVNGIYSKLEKGTVIEFLILHNEGSGYIKTQSEFKKIKIKDKGSTYKKYEKIFSEGEKVWRDGDGEKVVHMNRIYVQIFEYTEKEKESIRNKKIPKNMQVVTYTEIEKAIAIEESCKK
jgi:hypothetical protein